MLLPQSSLAPWPVGPSHPCAKCGEFVAGIAIGGLCPSCTRLLQSKAARIGRLAAIATTVPLALYVTWVLPADPTARLVTAGSVLLWYVLTFLIAKRVAWEWLK
ncbi:MAG TPA: hypothetical protein VGQ06_04435 [Gemmatimonadales bacterium]|nr:hypothetical protein [Gemmatimonadales bacterium]